MNPQAIIDDLIEGKEKEPSKDIKQSLEKELENTNWLNHEVTKKKIEKLKIIHQNLTNELMNASIDFNITDAQCRINQIKLAVYNQVIYTLISE